MREKWKHKPVLILLLFQATFNVKQVVIGAREDHLIGILGESVLLHIHRASGEEVREISWEKEKHAFLKCIPNQNICQVYKQQESRVHCFPDCSLRLSGLLGNDSGLYRAEILFNNGRLETKIIYLDILVPVSLPTIVVGRVNSSIHRRLTITCNITEGSLPQYFWEKDGQRLTLSQRYMLTKDNSSISIHNFSNSDCGTYTCTVRNSISRHKAERTMLGEDSFECATSGYLLIIIAAAICLFGFVLVVVFFNKRRTSRTDWQIVNERDRSKMNNEDEGGQYLVIFFPDSAQQPDRNGQENADQAVVYSTTASS
ncbi:hepatic and glial cell adhesion molecule-like isoform X1 [Mobula birostris]|uniref:hepatic and glial cell adhesion molecule-like isoform X1 n=1 Tax=Mobula birostris TaxID=1983395 RepID=UPI003B28136C